MGKTLENTASLNTNIPFHFFFLYCFFAYGQSKEEDGENYDDDCEVCCEKRVIVGICAMAKKSQSKPMREILTRLSEFEYIETLVFPEEVILNQPVEEWPLCDCLISFHSKGQSGKQHAPPTTSSAISQPPIASKSATIHHPNERKQQTNRKMYRETLV